MNRAVVIDCVPFVAAIVLSVATARLLLSVSGAKWRIAHLGNLHRDERGAVQSLSFVLTLPVFVMLMLFVIQLSQLTIARIVVEYAAYAAVRSASVWIPADLGDDIETANRIGVRGKRGEVRDERGNFFDVYSVTGPSRKLDRIQLAAATALMSVCPSRNVMTNSSHPGLRASTSLEHAYLAMEPSSASNIRIAERIRNKLAYALQNTVLEMQVRHRQDEPDLDRQHRVYPYPAEFEANEIGWQDQILLTVTHDFALLPGPGRFLAKRLVAPGRTTDEVSGRIRQQGNVFVYPLSATVRLSNEGEKPAIPFVQLWANQFATSIP